MSEKKYEIKWSKKSKIVSIRTVEGEVILTTNQRLKVEYQCYNYKMCTGTKPSDSEIEQLIDYSIERKEWEESNPIFKKHIKFVTTSGCAIIPLSMLLALFISGLGLYAAGIVGILLMGVWSLTAMIIYKIHKVPALPEFYRNLESYHLSDGPPG